MADEWTREGMEGRRPSCFDFFLDVCENGDACNYSHAPLHTASLKGVPLSGATKESVTEELAAFNPVHVAFTGNPAHLNFGKGLGKVGFFSEDDLVSAIKGTLKLPAGRSVSVVLDDHKCCNCGVAMRFSQGGVPYYKSSAVTGTKKDPKLIAKQALGPFDCGEVCKGKKKVESATRERALKQGEAVW